MNDESVVAEPWYRNPWVWLLIAIPSLTVAGCLVTLWLALTHPVSLVSDGPQPPAAAATAARGGQ